MSQIGIDEIRIIMDFVNVKSQTNQTSARRNELGLEVWPDVVSVKVKNKKKIMEGNQIMMTKLIKRAGLAVSGAMLLLPMVASANLVVDGSFEDPSISGTFTTINTGSSIGAWTVTAGSVDLINDYWQPSDGSQSVDVAGNINGTIQQTISGITDGQTYLLTFYMAGNPDGAPTVKTLEASMGDFSESFTFDTTGHTKDSMGWTEWSATFVATGDNYNVLSFQDLSGVPSPYGSALDNVSLTAVSEQQPAPVPEASTMLAGAMMLLPFGVGAIRSLRKERKA